MIQIIAGTFGYYNGRKVIPITEADGPQKFDPELEARLVKQGVAKFVEPAPEAEEPESTDPAGAPAPQDPDPAGSAPEGDPDTPDELPEYDKDMKLDELKEIAAAYGVDASAMRKKDDVIAAIEAAKQGDDTEDEAPPQPGVADPI
jgi:hypothetical protein